MDVPVLRAHLDDVMAAYDSELIRALDRYDELKDTVNNETRAELEAAEAHIIALVKGKFDAFREVEECVAALGGGAAGAWAGAALGSFVLPGPGTLVGFLAGGWSAGGWSARKYKSTVADGETLALRTLKTLGWDPYAVATAACRYEDDANARAGRLPCTMPSLNATLKALGGQLTALPEQVAGHLGVQHQSTWLILDTGVAKSVDEAIEAAIAFASMLDGVAVDRNAIKSTFVHATKSFLSKATSAALTEEIMVLPFVDNGTVLQGRGTRGLIGVVQYVCEFHDEITYDCCTKKRQVHMTLHKYHVCFQNRAELQNALQRVGI